MENPNPSVTIRRLNARYPTKGELLEKVIPVGTLQELNGIRVAITCVEVYGGGLVFNYLLQCVAREAPNFLATALPIFGLYTQDNKGGSYISRQEIFPVSDNEWRGIVRIIPKPKSDVSELLFIISGIEWLSSEAEVEQRFSVQGGPWKFAVPLNA